MATSDPRAYVYLQLPQSMEIVTAGLFELQPPPGAPTGSFVYNPAYLERPDAVPLDPYELPLAPRRMHTAKLGGLFGTLRDALPDAWGRRLIEQRAGRADLTRVDYLLNAPDDHAGALSFGRDKAPSASQRRFPRISQLRAVLIAASDVPDLSAGTFDHVQPDTSMGGARPKCVVEDDEGLWLAKFPHPDERWSHARVEAAMLALAQECGLRAARHRVETVGGQDVLLVQRFDRTRTAEGDLRHRMVSGLTVLGADDTDADRAKWSYLLLADELRRRSARPTQDLEELFRRMVFNALISNTNDHPRHHALIAMTDKWELSPAFDLTPHPANAERRELAMACGVRDRLATRSNLLSGHGQFKLSREHAETIVDEIRRVVGARWHPVLREHGVAPAECERLARSFSSPEFERHPALALP
ncbi:type II toxin-antitoxin system HipA family toxin [Piscinibacter sp.]|uniref:type II toxin-antitoxin system HipA family toxin n=1 Tax=Piscinibacter sp. TaxID=1903157 RepID=UPI002BECD0B9|nr:type II toxin-antitoxin system HipA family toxin [Albitalea sp.]HUG23962.1 type II toxin-antitoxin system HipA family toxin [Albitalea sp.]